MWKKGIVLLTVGALFISTALFGCSCGKAGGKKAVGKIRVAGEICNFDGTKNR